jgi:RNA polymerase sigma-70 factor (ECF subfamily)
VSADGERDDRRLIADHLAGDRDAFTILVRRHRDRLWAVALRTTGDPDEAADALQDALISALRGAAGYRGEAAVTTWLHRVVINACLDRLRRRQARPWVPLDGREFAGRQDDHAATVARVDILAALARLPEHQRVAMILVDLEDLPLAEVAAILEVPEGTVKSRCSRARTAMALMLREIDPSRPATEGNRSGNERVQAEEPPAPTARWTGSGQGW